MTKFWMGVPALALAACTGSDLVPVTFDVPNAKEAIVFRIDAAQLAPWDTVKIEDGVFKIDLPLDSSGSTFYALSFDHGASLRLGIERGDKIKGSVSIDKGITTYDLKGSELSEQLLTHYQPLRHTAMLLDSLDQESAQYQGQPDAAERNAALFARYEARIGKHREAITKMVQDNPSTLANIFALYQSAGNYYIFNADEDQELFKMAAEAMSEAHPNHPILQVFIQSAIRQ